MKLKIVDTFDATVSLEANAQVRLTELLTDPSFQMQISDHLKCGAIEFTGMLFQPVPYTPQATKGMPVEYEPYHASPDYVIINVPPSFMFQAKITQPSRLCAIYQKVHGVEDRS